jgi:pimeloyl-ACP methyl ester carboxylesterase
VAKVPGVGYALAQSMRFEPIVRSPFGFGDLTAERLPIDLLRSFLAPLIADKAVRRDAMKFFGGADSRDTVAAAARLADLDLPALLIWGTDDTLFPMSDGERLARTLTDVRLIPVAGARTFVPLDRPEVVADAIAAFVEARPVAGRRSA